VVMVIPSSSNKPFQLQPAVQLQLRPEAPNVGDARSYRTTTRAHHHPSFV
jgi:hypothetical protein